MGEYPCVGQLVGQTKFELEINHWDRYVNEALVLRKSPLHPSLEKYGRCTWKIFFFVSMMRIKNLACTQIFYSGLSDSILV